MIELTQQLGIIMVGKQILNNFMEIVLPLVTQFTTSSSQKPL